MPREFENSKSSFRNIPSENSEQTGQFYTADNVKEFISRMLEKKAARLPLKDGVELCFRKEEIGWGISLSICNRVQWPNLLADTLKRRFVEADRYEGHFLCIDSRNNFVGWYTLPPEELDCRALENIVHRMLSLMGCRLQGE